ncbi:hypothetical protein IWW47_004100 [Coemansia sp. RSA 2052]|nr:hypothetical protein IWW47_004100 [Coemansia sp. RSA 2052]
MGNRMSFSVTPEEQARVEIFKSMGMVLDPRQAADLIMVIVITVAYSIQFLAVLFMLWNRKYPPIKAKSPWNMSLIFVASIFWFIGIIQINGHAPLKGTPLTQCKAVGIWLFYLMGTCPVSGLIALRSYGLYQVFYRNRPYRGIPLYASAGLLVGVLLTFGIVTQAVPDDISIYYIELVDSCGCTLGFQVAVYVLIWILWLAVAILSWRIRNIRSSFNESREISITCIIVFGVLTFMTALTYAKPTYPLNLTARILASSLNHLSAMSIWWVPMAVPLYKCLIDREAYLKQWIHKLRQDGLQRAYHIDTRSTERSTGASDENRSYLHSTIHVDMPNKELGSTNANGEFFYAAGTEKATVQMGAIVAVHTNSSSSNLVQHSQPPQPAARRPWDRLTNAVSASPSASTQPYTPIVSFSQPATNTPQRPAAAPNSVSNAKYSADGRQLL